MTSLLPKSPKKMVILNFDINKTILMRDNGVPIEKMLNSLMSECVWGIVKPGLEDNSVAESSHCGSLWQEIGEIDPSFDGNPSSTKPCMSDFQLPTGPQRTTRDDDIMTFDDFLERKTQLPKAQKKKLKREFCTAGSGKRLIGHYNNLLSTLEAPPEVLARAEEAGNVHLFQDKKYFSLIPAFFRLVDLIAQRAAEGTFETRILFRTFGSDLDDVLSEFNLYCEGLHPAFRPTEYRTYDGRTPGYVDRRVKMPGYVARVKRTGPRNEETFLAHVTTDVTRGETGRTVTVTEGGIEAFSDVILRDWFGYSSDGRIDASPATQSAGVADDYKYWASNSEDCRAGKLHLVCDTDLEHGLTQLFFDDNIERDDVHIVDCRNRQDFASLGVGDVWRPNYHEVDASQQEEILADILAMIPDLNSLQIQALQSLVKVHPFQAIKNIDYFTNIVNRHMGCLT